MTAVERLIGLLSPGDDGTHLNACLEAFICSSYATAAHGDALAFYIIRGNCDITGE